MSSSVLVCGGTASNGSVVSFCGVLETTGDWSSSSNIPTLDRERTSSAAAQLDRTRWWVTGGGLFELGSTAVMERGYDDAAEAFQGTMELPEGGERALG